MAEAASATKDNEERRRSILAAAAELMCERGFADTRIADVAKRSEVSSALVIYYFGTRDRLLVEALTLYEEEFYRAMSETMSNAPAFADRIDRIVSSCCVARADDESPGDWGLWLDVWAMATRHPEIAAVRKLQDTKWRALLEDVVREGIESGEIPEVNARYFALTFTALLDGLAIQCALADSEVTPAVAYEMAMSYAETALDVELPRLMRSAS
ncbi:TetR/AcrR family transcriptional regulator [Gordonia jinhuaensis]|uniref:TetR family transcriptional regulator n=1 Tax=Gordonia jinhuaensis TaxID=1517702 RepID=A0A916T4F4_9ACTN|nr:TetR family transcriptional regulator C-terminal domain-containing protein [Gordonia jinhuaensis]GGB27687.1 TetR family transcriptional regulator [Gordonia jinhuaensis]